ncbi:MAG: EAL domain-containing protein [Desulfobacterales bacterium]|nr:EAL domain-containing protein [Desulfobacterales bacterium]
MTDRKSGPYLPEAAQLLLDSKIMMVDDEPSTLAVVRSFLKRDGYRNFILIDDSRQALKSIEETRPDVLLLDLMMPEVSGFDILKAVRRHPKLGHLPVIILTASEEADDKLHCLDLGATDFLAKPVDPSELRLRVRNTLTAKAYLDQLAYYDRQTNLPNRHTFLEHLEWTLNWSKHNENRFALLSIELDQFDTISDTVGLLAGDEVLREVSDRLKKVIHEGDSPGRVDSGQKPDSHLSRFEGGVFTLLLQRISTEGEAAQIAKRILESIREPMAIENAEIYFTASIGIAIYPTENKETDDFLHLASSARNYAKNQGGDRFQFSSRQIEQQYKRRLTLEAALRKALEKNEFLLYYQPRVDIQTGAVASVEALLRWRWPDGRIILPNDFIPMAEETGLIVPIGKWVINRACAQLAQWHRKKKIKIGMSVNLSAIQFLDRKLPAVVKAIIDHHGIEPGFLTLELTESILMNDIEDKIEVMSRLKSLGVKLAIDDFGTGFSSLSYLRKLPLDELKIDKSFVDTLLEEEKSRALASSVIYLGRNLGLLTVAEGVEEKGQLDFLQQQRCDLYQGALFSMPISVSDLEQRLYSG